MYQILFTNKMKRDVERIKKRGNIFYNPSSINTDLAILFIIVNNPLPNCISNHNSFV